MIFRVTQRLAKKIKVIPVAPMPPHDNPLLDWTANLFMVSRWQRILLTNSQSLYSVAFPGKGIPNGMVFFEQSMKALRDTMALDGIVGLFETIGAAAMHSISFCKANDRRVLGSMNELVFQARCDLIEFGYSLRMVNQRLNRIPMSRLSYNYAVEEFAALTKQSKP